jgi:methyl-accepting chemotaxis protein
MVADNAGSASRDVLAGASGIGNEAETLRVEVDQFLAAVREDTADERRRYERISVKGILAGVQTKGRPPSRMPLRDIARGGASMTSDWTQPVGTALEIGLPDGGGAVPARVVRCGDGLLGVVFSSEPHALARIDRVLGVLMHTRRRPDRPAGLRLTGSSAPHPRRSVMTAAANSPDCGPLRPRARRIPALT